MMIKQKVLFPFLALILIFFTTQAFVQETEVVEKEINLSGKVIDADTGKALADVKVDLVRHDKSVTTDSKGAFTFSDLKPAIYTVKVTHDGYQDYKKDVEVREGDKQVTIELKPSKAGST